MKYSEITKLKATMMTALEKAVDGILDQVQANEQNYAAANQGHADLQPGYFDAALVLDFPQYAGTNGEGFVIFGNPVVMLKEGTYRDSHAQNYSHSVMSEKLRQIKERANKA